jgi:hydroxymethylpyrimidine/phosphomethylpyrimidine kinase
MLPTPASVLTTAQAISDYQLTPLVLDTVLHATTGAALSTPDTSAAIRQYLFPLTQLVTPNLDECRHYTGLAITQREHMKTAAQAFLEMGCAAVLIKGGHLLDADLTDYYLDRTGQAHWFNHARIASTNLHGTGCTLSAAIATELGKGRAMLSAIQTAIDFVQRAIHAAQHERIGQGYGPIQQGSASCQ